MKWIGNRRIDLRFRIFGPVVANVGIAVAVVDSGSLWIGFVDRLCGSALAVVRAVVQILYGLFDGLFDRWDRCRC